MGHIFLFVFSILVISCSSQPEKSALSSISPCFKFIFQNKISEFKANGAECKNYRNSQGMTSLMMAISKDNNDIAEFLLEQNVDVNETEQGGLTALTFAANKNNARIVQLLRRHGARIEIIGDNLSPFMMAVRNSSANLIQLMNPSSTEINLKAEDGWTALYFAIRRADEDILLFLLDHGACVNTVDSYKQSPLDFAKEIKWKKGIQLLRRKKSC